MADAFLACPFCRELSLPGERSECPHCGLALAPAQSLPAADDDDAIPPEHQRLPLSYWRRARGAIAVIALLGIGTFFAPWAHVTAPEIHDLDGFRLARELHTPWAAFAAFFVLLPVALSRRTIMKMRGARVAVGFLGLVPLMTTVMRIATTPTSGRYLPIRVEWGWGLYACGALGLLAVLLAPLFGGRVPPPVPPR
jgi:hypothetical protein